MLIQFIGEDHFINLFGWFAVCTFYCIFIRCTFILKFWEAGWLFFWNSYLDWLMKKFHLSLNPYEGSISISGWWDRLRVFESILKGRTISSSKRWCWCWSDNLLALDGCWLLILDHIYFTLESNDCILIGVCPFDRSWLHFPLFWLVTCQLLCLG